MQKDKFVQQEQTARLMGLHLQMWMYQLIGLLIFVTSRLFYLLQHTTTDRILEQSESIPLFVWNSWRFDIQALTYISLPAIIATLAVPYFGSKATAKCSSFMRYYYAVMLSLLTLIVTAEFFFHDNFNSRYNVVFFDFFDEGPLGLLQTMWQDYPFLTIATGILLVGILISVIGKYIARIRITPRRGMGVTASVVTSILIAGITFVFMRGSVTKYTLQVEAFIVSTNETMNNAVPNSIYLLKKAYKERKNSLKLLSDEEILRKDRFSSIEEAISVAGFKGASIDDAIFDTIDSCSINSQEHPNVLIIIAESWSNHLLTMDCGDSLDILCAMRPHLQQDIHMKNIQSVRNGTIYSLETLTLGMPYMHFFNSRYRHHSFESSIAYPFKKNGYDTSFILGMDPTWENLLEGLTYQHFDSVIGRRDILHNEKGSTTSEIGVYDEFLLLYLEGYLSRQTESGKPQFIMALTTTNHPPFTYPENMNLPPLTELWYDSPYLSGERDVLTKYGLGIQYTNETLGKFLGSFKKSELSLNTIVLITGDHNVRSILNYSENGVPAEKRHAVPMYIYLPPKFRTNDIDKSVIENRFGSHFDILPTIAPMTFSEGTKYLNLGNNLLDTTLPDSIFYSYNERQTLSPDYNKNDSITRMVHARETLMKIYYQRRFKNN